MDYEEEKANRGSTPKIEYKREGLNQIIILKSA